tara:strand:- start:1003 stop:1167 length:165 start_codon:yes stop_codon:yes gene_type:complete
MANNPEMTEQERIDRLEKNVKQLKLVNYIRFAIVVLGLIGVTSWGLKKIKALKK